MSVYNEQKGKQTVPCNGFQSMNLAFNHSFPAEEFINKARAIRSVHSFVSKRGADHCSTVLK